ncbi:hypothetical protein V5G93_24160, partial [Escherichia albertii]|uniref:hypothetical protein n=1 Tax=Escherichia albertii TaxID=208962 RepID=UPI0037AAA60B
VEELININEKSNRTFLHKLIKYRLVPAFKLSLCFLLRFCLKTRSKDRIFYFDVDRIDILASLILRNWDVDKQIIWLWNPTAKIMKSTAQLTFFINLLKKNKVEIWTFDQKDASFFGLKYHNQIYSLAMVNLLKKTNNNIDVLFVGKDKERLKYLLMIKKRMDRENLATYFHIVKDEGGAYTRDEKLFLSDGILSYEDYIDKVQRAKCLLDINQSGQTGLTLRVLEALFFSKKLITNNPDIAKYNFYNPNNIM